MLKIIRRERPASSSSLVVEAPSSLARMSSILHKGSLSLPSLRWRDGNKVPSHHKTPLLNLQLSSHSFLDSYIEDGSSATAIYTVKTTDAFTSVFRHSGEGDFTKTAMIKWPGNVSTKKAGEENNKGVLIKMRSHRWSKGQSFLRPGPDPDSSSKFAIPDYPNSMKWKRYGTSYWCTTSGVTGPIATLDLSGGPEPITLAVYETLHDKYDPQALTAYKGVSLLLLDYLVITALFCATDVMAWKLLRKVDDIPASHAPDPSDQELRYTPEFHDHPYAAKELYDLTSLTTTAMSVPRSLESYSIGRTPYLRSDASSSRRQSGSFDSTREIWTEDYGTQPSSSVDSMQHYTVVNSSIPDSQNIPPVPPLPQKFASVNRPTRSGSSSSHHEFSRSLDRSHTAAIQLQLSQQPPIPENTPSSEQLQNISTSTHLSRSPSQWRPLPKPPTTPGLRRIQSSTHLDAKPSTEGRSGQIRSLPSTPVAASKPNKASITEGNDCLQVNALAPSVTKTSRQDLTKWVNALKDSEQATASSDVVFSNPPPSYASIYWGQRDAEN